MSDTAWRNLKSRGDLLKIHDKCPNNKCFCQKKIFFTPQHFQVESAGFENTKRKTFKGTEKMWQNFIEPGLKIATPIISAGETINSSIG